MQYMKKWIVLFLSPYRYLNVIFASFSFTDI